MLPWFLNPLFQEVFGKHQQNVKGFMVIKNKQDGEYTHYLTSVRLKAHTGGNVLASYQSGVTKLEGGGNLARLVFVYIIIL